MRLKVLPITDVTSYQLCCGCGACAYVNPDRYTMVDVSHLGRRPIARNSTTRDERDPASLICPGSRLEHTFDRSDPNLVSELLPGWGPVLEVWEGHAADEQIRFYGSSGGVVSALALYCLEHEQMHGVLHTAARPDAPYLNHTVLSRSRDELLAAAGSRYSPASPCDGLEQIENSPSPCVFVGKPCDVAGVVNARAINSSLDKKIGLTIAFFCAGTPSTEGTLQLLRKAGVDDPTTITALRYRGRGWPGRWTVKWRNGESEHEGSMTYDESWSFLQRYRQWRCYICPDHTGEFADVAVGDPWDRPASEGESGTSLVIARTSRGREILRNAVRQGYLKLTKVSPSRLPAAQPNLLRTRGALWGRLWTIWLLGAPVPEYRGFPRWRFWLHSLSMREKKQSILGTARRVFTKRLRQRVEVGAALHRTSEPGRATRD